MSNNIQEFNELIEEKKIEFIRSLTDDPTIIVHSSSGYYQLALFPKKKFREYNPNVDEDDFILKGFSGRRYVLISQEVNKNRIELFKKCNFNGTLRLEDRMRQESSFWLYGKEIA